VSLVPRRDGSTGHFPHLLERAKPGLIAVTPAGARFVNEAGSYHDFMSALFASIPAGAPVEAWLVCDHRFIRRYGLGHAMPAPLPLGPSLRSGYLKRGRTIAELARACNLRKRHWWRRWKRTTPVRATAAILHSDAARHRTTASTAIRRSAPTPTSRRSSTHRFMR
jgi:hypothetical protein